jgi:heptosyltransferase I
MRILIIKTSALGDILQTFPILIYLKKRFPHCTIDWLAEASAEKLLMAQPLINRVLKLDTRRWRRNFCWATASEIHQLIKQLRSSSYDYVFDFQGNLKAAVLTAFAKAKHKVGFGWKSSSEKGSSFALTEAYNPPSNLNMRKQYLHLVQSFFQDKGLVEEEENLLVLQPEEQEKLKQVTWTSDFRLMIAFGSRWVNKQLKEEAWLSLLKKIESKISPFFIFLYSSPEEQRLAETLSANFPHVLVLGKVSLPFIHSLMKQMDQVLAVDSALLHLAGCAKVPTFSFFGPSSSEIYRPEGPFHLSYQGLCPYGVSFIKRCPRLRRCATGACLREASPFELFRSWEMAWESLQELKKDGLRH